MFEGIEMSTLTIRHFRAMAATGDVRKALAVLNRLDAADAVGATR